MYFLKQIYHLSRISILGKLLDAGRLNKSRKLNQTAKIGNYHQAFVILEQCNFGTRCDKSTFRIHDNILQIIQSSDSHKEDLIRMRVSISMLRDAIGQPDYIPPPKKQKKNTGMR